MNQSIPLSQNPYGEEEFEAVRKVLASGWLIIGPQTEAFEKAYAKMLGVSHAIAVNSGSSALLVAMQALGVGPDDEIVVPNMSFISTGSAALYLGANVRFTDITLDDYGMNPEDLKRCLTKKTKLIVPVHYAGQSCQLESIVQIARDHHISVLEDAAESHLAQYQGRNTGTIGAMGIFSFTPTKPMTTGEGGMIVTNCDELAKKARLIRNFGDSAKFQWDSLGFNFRMPEVMGALGLVQLPKLKGWIEARRRLGARYSAAFKDIPGLIIPSVRSYEDHIYQLYTLRLDHHVFYKTRDEWMQALEDQKIASRLYYPTLHKQKVFKGYDASPDTCFPNAGLFEKTALSLPLWAQMSEAIQDKVIDAVLGLAKHYRR